MCLNTFHLVPITCTSRVFIYNYCPQTGSTPLNVAAQKNHVKVVEILLAAGANVDLAREVRHCLMVHSKLHNWKDRKANNHL